ncbi:MAG: flavin reductase family protein [Clostridia bacterium]
MENKVLDSGTYIYPLPVVLVSCGNESVQNILTVSWTGTVCTSPAMTYISIRKERYSYDIIKKSREFCINLTTENLAYIADYVGTKSGRDVDKFKTLNLTAQKASVISAPMIKESPVSIECRVVKVEELGSHDMFLAKVVAVNIDRDYLDINEKIDAKKLKAIAYLQGEYFKLGESIGKRGFLVKSK